jgi:hypothetical protein
LIHTTSEVGGQTIWGAGKGRDPEETKFLLAESYNVRNKDMENEESEKHKEYDQSEEDEEKSNNTGRRMRM